MNRYICRCSAIALAIIASPLFATQLHEAVQAGDISRVHRLLVSREFNDLYRRDAAGWTPLHWAIYCDDEAMITEISKCISSDVQTRYTPIAHALNFAYTRGKYQIVSYLVSSGVRERDGGTPLHTAVLMKDRDGGAWTHCVRHRR